MCGACYDCHIFLSILTQIQLFSVTDHVLYNIHIKRNVINISPCILWLMSTACSWVQQCHLFMSCLNRVHSKWLLIQYKCPLENAIYFFCKALRVALSTLPNKDSAVIQRTTNDALMKLLLVVVKVPL